MAFLTGLPYYFLNYDRSFNKPTWFQEPPESERILLIEDFAGTGNTLIDCKQFLLDSGYSTDTFVVCKDHLSASQPDFYCFECQDKGARFILPWERHRLYTTTLSGSQKLLDHEYKKTAWDMDGIFLDDVPSEHYNESLESALLLRDTYPLSPLAPILEEQDVIVTGRPMIDKDRTILWMARHGIKTPLYLRDDQIIYPTKETTAVWKGKKALYLGCTRYVESEAQQAVHIAKVYPELQVVWWNAGEPVLIQATSRLINRGGEIRESALP